LEAGAREKRERRRRRRERGWQAIKLNKRERKREK